MGVLNFFRISFLVIFSIILFAALIIGGTFWTVSYSLNYNNVETHAFPIVKQAIEKQMNITEMSQNFEQVKSYCQLNPDYVYNDENGMFSISCQEVMSGTSETIIDSKIKDNIKKVYYTQYTCTFFECFKTETKGPFFLISEMSQKTFAKFFYYSLIALIIIILIMFFLTADKRNLMIILGSLFIIASLPFMKLTSIITPDRINAGEFKEYVSEFLLIFLGKATTIFWIMLVLGLILLIAGIILRVLQIWEKQEPARKKKSK